MPKFILIDQSLKGVGGHHYEYASHILSAAEDAGYQVVLATHRKFQSGEGFPDRWRIIPIFRYTTYSNYTIYHSCSSSQSKSRRGYRDIERDGVTANESLLARLRRRLSERVFRSARRRRIASFARSINELIEQVGLEEDDQVFIPTLSELDLVGLADLLEYEPKSRLAQWHLQFHYSFFDGREPDYPQQTQQFEATREIFSEALGRIGGHRLHFYNTTKQLAAQYNRLGVATFHGLPYPVNPAFHERSGKRPLDAPLRVTCVGAIRKEKGYEQLNHLLCELWDDHFATGRTRLVVQSNKRKFALPLPPNEVAANAVDSERQPPVEYAPHPLSMEQYVDLIRQADIGLLLYDSERYYVRCSGVLVEMLSVGVPVIATAGCWMAEQLAEPNFQHVDRLAESLPEIASQTLGEVVICDQESNDPDTAMDRLINVPTGTTDLVVRWQWKSPTERGTYVGLTVEAFDSEGCRLDARSAITGHRDGNQTVASLFHLDSRATGIRLIWRNAYHDGLIRLADVSLRFISAAGLPGGRCPAGAVGLIAAEAAQVGPLVRDLVAHWPHYRATALQFAQSWAGYHNPHRIVTELLDQAGVLSDDSKSDRSGTVGVESKAQDVC